MTKESFISILNRSSPEEIVEYLKSKGKLKLHCPVVFYDIMPPKSKSIHSEDYKDAIDVEVK